jgi:metal-sulfur cluster biosynthetic enzyme
MTIALGSPLEGLNTEFWRKKSPVIEKLVQAALVSVREAEHNIPITELKMVEKVEVVEGTVSIRYHCLSPYCPAMLVLATGLDLKKRLLAIEGVKGVQITLRGHYMADEINQKIRDARFERT